MCGRLDGKFEDWSTHRRGVLTLANLGHHSKSMRYLYRVHRMKVSPSQENQPKRNVELRTRSSRVLLALPFQSLS
jgi:hypothetical protein